MNAEYQPIETAPKDGTSIIVTDMKHGDHLMFWKDGVWQGKHYGIIGPIRIYWDESVSPLTHWRPNK